MSENDPCHGFILPTHLEHAAAASYLIARGRQARNPLRQAAERKLLNRASALLLFFGVLLALATSRAASDRIPITIAQIRNLPPRPDEIHWEQVLGSLLRHRLRCVSSLRVLAPSSMEFGSFLADLKSGQRPTDQQVRRLGEAIEARHVVWGEYHREGDGWELKVQIMEVHSAQITGTFSRRSTNWLELAAGATSTILDALHITPTAEASQQMDSFFRVNAEALELFSRAGAREAEGKPASTVVELLHQAVEADPGFALARQALACGLVYVGQVEDARREAKTAVKLEPKLAHAHLALATVYLADKLDHLAEEELREAMRLDPEWPDSFVSLGDVLANKGRWAEASSVLDSAAQIAPHDPELRARLGFVYAHLGQRDKAFEELQTAAGLPNKDFTLDRRLADGYVLLSDQAKALAHLSAFIAAAQSRGLQSADVENAKKQSAELQKHLVPQFLDINPPEWLTPPELTNALRTLLTPDECRLVTVPFTATKQMTNWAEQVRQGASDDLEKATRLFRTLCCRIHSRRDYFGLTADQAFTEWSKAQPQMSCQDYALLYMALSRAIGLKTYYVRVDRDYTTNTVFHACAAVRVSGKTLLVDPLYQWLGIPHQGYEILSDLRVIAAFLAQSRDLQREQIGLKLARDWGVPFLTVEAAQIQRRDLEGARRALKGLLEREPSGWLACAGQAYLNDAEGRFGISAENWRACLRLRPDYPDGLYGFATALYKAGKWKEAREEYRAYLRTRTDPEFQWGAREAIKQINETFGDEQR